VQDAGEIALATRTVGKLTAALDMACSFAWSPAVLGVGDAARGADRGPDAGRHRTHQEATTARAGDEAMAAPRSARRNS
jgi:hypothetical protein